MAGKNTTKESQRPYRGRRNKQRKLAKQRRHAAQQDASKQGQAALEGFSDVVSGLAALSVSASDKRGVSCQNKGPAKGCRSAGENRDGKAVLPKKVKPKMFHVPAGMKLKVLRFRLDAILAGKPVDYLTIRDAFAGA